MASWPSPRGRLLGRAPEDCGRGASDEAKPAPGLTLDDLILRRGESAKKSTVGVNGGANGADQGEKKCGGGALFSRARAPVVVTGWQNSHATRGRGNDDEGKDRNDRSTAFGGDRGASNADERRAVRRPTDLADVRVAVGVVRDAVDYNAGYLSPNDVNADLDGPPSPVRGFTQRLMSLEASPTPRGKHLRKRATTHRSAEPDGSYALERRFERARADRKMMRGVDALAFAARRMPMSPTSNSAAPTSASRLGQAFRTPCAYWSNGDVTRDERERKVSQKRGRGRPPKNARPVTPPWSADDYEDFDEDFDGAEEAKETWSNEDEDEDDRRIARDTNIARALERISRGANAAPQRPPPKQTSRSNGSRKGKPGPKPGMAAAKKAAMIAAGIPIPVLPPGVKRGRGRPPKSMLIIPDGPVNAYLPDHVIRSVAQVDREVVRKVKRGRASIERPGKISMYKMFDVDPRSNVTEERTSCEACGRVDGEDRMLLCDGCDRGYHTHCLVPRLDKVPESEWFCYECVTQNRPKTVAAEAFEHRQAAKARQSFGSEDSSVRMSDKLKLNGEPKRKPGPKPGSRTKRMQLDQNNDENAFYDAERFRAEEAYRRRRGDDVQLLSTAKRPVGSRKDPNEWSQEQLEALQNAQVNVDLGLKNFWTVIAGLVPGKSAKQCRERVYGALGISEVGDVKNIDSRHDGTPNCERALRTPKN